MSTQHVYTMPGEPSPELTFRRAHGTLDLTDAVKVIEHVTGRPPREAQVLDSQRGSIALPNDLEPGTYQLYYEVHWSSNLVEHVPAIPVSLTVKPPYLELGESE